MNLIFKKIITIGLATIFSVGASIMAVSAATLPNIPIQNAKFVSEDWYIKQNTHFSYQMWQNDCGTGIGSNGVENQLGSLKVIEESN